MRTLFLLLLLSVVQLSAQIDLSLQRLSPPVNDDGRELSLAWAGGLNNPQPEMTDLDGDGAEDDLYIFDRGADVHLAFVRDEQGNWRAAHELVRYFPRQIQHWVLLRDFDDDGVDDLFAYSDTFAAGVLVYKGSRGEDGLIRFTRLVGNDDLPILYFPQSDGDRTQVYVSTIDYPAIDDIDCDGDLDILTFSIGGGYVHFYQNQSVERGFGRDSLLFELVDDCYGGIYESGLSPVVDLADAPDECVLFDVQSPGSARHAGSTLLTLDRNGDGIKELLLGDISFTEIVALENSGNCQDAWFTDQELDFPADDVPVDIDFFPASFYLDLNQDGVSDFAAAPNQAFNSADYSVFWYYENLGQEDNPQLVLRDSQYLVRDMIDLGTGAAPGVVDVDGDGDPDLIVGNTNRYTGNVISSASTLRYYRNDSQDGDPAFTLVDTDFMGMQNFNNTTFGFAPTYGDLNGDGKADAMIGGQNGKLFFFPNTTSGSGASNFGSVIYPFADIDVGQYARPRIVDLDRDGLNDLVIGSRAGRIHYYRNIGTTTNPEFNPDPESGDNLIQLGGIDTRDINFSVGYAAPYLLDRGDDWIVFTGTNRGQIEVYDQVEDNISGNFRQLSGRMGDLAPGTRSEIVMADFTGNGRLEMIIGNNRGGLEFFASSLDVNGQVVNNRNPATVAPELLLYPNPTRDILTISGLPDDPAQLNLYDTSGRHILKADVQADRINLNLNRMPPGVYWLRYESARGATTRRVVVE